MSTFVNIAAAFGALSHSRHSSSALIFLQHFHRVPHTASHTDTVHPFVRRIAPICCVPQVERVHSIDDATKMMMKKMSMPCPTYDRPHPRAMYSSTNSAQRFVDLGPCDRAIRKHSCQTTPGNSARQACSCSRSPPMVGTCSEHNPPCIMHRMRHLYHSEEPKRYDLRKVWFAPHSLTRVMTGSCCTITLCLFILTVSLSRVAIARLDCHLSTSSPLFISPGLWEE